MENLLANFNDLSIEQRKALIVLLKRRGISLSQLPIASVKRDAPLPLSYGQQRLWFLAQLEPDSSAYHIADAVWLNGKVDASALQRSVDDLVARHEGFRTTFHDVNGKAVQVIHQHLPTAIRWLDLATEKGDIEALVKSKIEAIEQQTFDLTQGPMLRVAIFKLPADRHVLSLVMHHIIADEWSMDIVITEFAEIYGAYCEAREPKLSGLAIGYADFAVWQRHWLEAGEMERQLKYWTEKLAGEQLALELPFDKPRQAQASDHGAKLEFPFPDALNTALRQYSQKRGATLFMVLLALFKMLLYRYSGQQAIRVGVPVANRNRRETENLVGFFVNTQVLQTELHGGLSFRQVLDRVKDTALGAQAHPDLPFDQLVEALSPERSLNRNPLFQVMYNHQYQQAETADALSFLNIAPFARDSHTTQFDLILDSFESGKDGIVLLWTYASDLFDHSTIERMARHFCRLAEVALATPETALRDLPLLNPVEWYWSSAYETKPCQWVALPEAIRAQAQAHPDSEALVCAGQALSYVGLQNQVNRLACSLSASGVNAGDVVGLYLPRSTDMIVASLAVWQCGAAFLPLDQDYPAERLGYLLADAGVSCLLSRSEGASVARAPASIMTLALDRLELSGCSGTAPTLVTHPEQTAYLIYTSGSTGQPKGVAVSHGALARHCQAMADVYAMQPGDVCLHFASFSFDAAIEQWTVPLRCGAKVVISGQDLWSVEQTLAAIDAHRINRIDLPPAYLTELARHINHLKYPAELASCTVGGEALPRDSLALIQSRLRPQRLLNAYGPTETVITPLVWDATAACDSAYAPIGTPIGDRSAYILDADLNPVPIGVAGELYIGGPSLAQVYWHKPGLTAERFIPDPFNSRTGSRLYRTGDRVRRRADGVIDYLGRLDQQIKLRGYRIELGEIEAALLAQADIDEAAVIVGEGGQLLAYVTVNTLNSTLSREAREQAASLRHALQARLPEYMLPSHILVLPQLPKLSSGKLDRRSLPAPERIARTRTAPRNAVESQLAAIWREVLGLESIGVEDNFFELGGDSIISLQVVSRARQAGLALSPKDIFSHQTIAALADLAAKLTPIQAGTTSISVINGRDVPLTPIQAEFFAADIPQRQHWNQSVLLKTDQGMNVQALELALRHLLQHHDALRLRFCRDKQWRQYYAEAEKNQDILWLRQAADTVEIGVIAQLAQRSLDLQSGPLLRAAYIEVADGSYRLLLVVHHLVVDGVSWRIVLEDLQALYRQIANAEIPQLPAKTSSFQAWAEALVRRAGEFSNQLDFWRQQLAGNNELPSEFGATDATAADAETVMQELDPDSTRRLLQDAPTAYRTRIDELLLTALARVLCRWSGKPALTVDLEGHGREVFDHAPDVSRTVGWFTSVYPVKLTPAADLAESIKTVKEQLRRIPYRGLGYGLLKYLAGDTVRTELQTLPKPAVCFNYLGQFDASFTDTNFFRPAGESRGDEHDSAVPLDYALEINGQIYDGRLVMNWTYNRKQFSTANMKRLAAEFNQELVVLIEHCSQGPLAVTPSDVPLAGLTQAQLDQLPMETGNLQDIYPLTPMQQGMLFHSLYEADATSYVSSFDVRLSGLDAVRFSAAWQSMMERHPVLRTGFVSQGGWTGPLQIVHKRVPLPLRERDWRGRADAESALHTLIAELQSQGLQTVTPPLFKLELVRLDEDMYHLIWLSHHLLLDGWSSARLLGEVLAHYRGATLPASVAEFRHYIAWLQARDGQAAEGYWRQQLGLLEEPAKLADALAIGVRKSGHGLLPLLIGGYEFANLRQIAQAGKLTVNTLVQAAWTLLLQRYTGNETVAFGVTVSGRPADLPGAEDMIGLFINTLPIIQAPRADSRIVDWLQGLQQDNLNMREHEATPLADIQRWWGKTGEALFDSLLVFENYPLSEALRQRADDGLRISGGEHSETTNYPLTLAVQSGDTLQVVFDYDRQFFSAETVAGLAEHFKLLLNRLAAQTDERIGEVQCLTTTEQARFKAWNVWPKACHESIPVQELIRRRAAQQADAVALICGAQALSYSELERQANRLAHRLIELGVQAETRVALLLPRGLDALVAMLAVLKAGGAYLPLDPGQPLERLTGLLADAQVRVAVSLASLASCSDHAHAPADGPHNPSTHCAGQRHFKSEAVTFSPAGEDWAEAQQTALTPILLNLDETDLSAYPASAPDLVIHPEQLAYLILTSGSTGKPKSVAVAHGALSRHIQAAGDLYAYSSADRALHFAAFTFDAAMEQWLAPLCHGAGVVLGCSDWTGDDTVAAMAAHQVTVIYPPTSHLLHLADTLSARQQTVTLRIACVGGEAVSAAALSKIREVLKPKRIINGYGPTETVITPLAWQADDSDWSGYAPIGRAVGERTLHILDKDLNPLPLGAVGELYIGGPCLARGYHQRPELSAERFLPDPFAADGSRLYRTGDRVRYRADGNVDYLGRADQQIKLRGYRIEPGEIEAALRQLPGISDAYVMLRDDHGRRYLAAYLETDETEPAARLSPALTPDAIQTELSQRLPDYMVPAQYVLLDRLPRTAHGKVDRRSLPAPGFDEAPAPQAPANASERLLLQLWQDLLGRQTFGIRDNFFELGGDSIISIQLVSRARAQGLHFTPKDLFQHQTIESLARVAVCAGEQHQAGASEPQPPATGNAPLLPIQHAFFAQALPNPQHWNQSLLLKARQTLNPEHLHRALQQLVAHHDSLRLRYRQEDGHWLQGYAEAAEPVVLATPASVRPELVDGQLTSGFDMISPNGLLEQHHVEDAQAIPAIAQHTQCSLNLEHGPLFKAVHIRVGDGTERLLLIAHHLIVDAVSWRILLEDLQSLYQQLQQGQAPQLPAKTASYQAWGEALQRYADSPALQRQHPYWHAQTGPHTSHWPCDNPQGRAENRDRASVTLSLDSDRTRQLLYEANSAYRTRIQELLLTALAQTLSEWTGQTDIAVELEGHGREADAVSQANTPDLDLSRSIGWFTSLYPVTLTVRQDLAETIKTVKEQLRGIPDNGLGHGVLTHFGTPPAAASERVEDPDETGDCYATLRSAHPTTGGYIKPKVTFNYLGQFDASFDANALLQPADEDSGDERDPEAPLGNELEINGEIYQSQLHLNWGYSCRRYEPRTIQRLLDRYQHNLEKLLDHCLQAEVNLTPGDVPLAGLNQTQLDALPIAHKLIEDIYPLSPMQQGILFHALRDPEANLYVTQMAVDLQGLDISKFLHGWREVLRRHPVLRSGFVWQGELPVPLQVVYRDAELPVELIDWQQRQVDEDTLAALRQAEYRRGFDLRQAPLLRLTLVNLPGSVTHLIWTGHHLLLDGWSTSLMLGEVMAMYAGMQPAHGSQGIYRDYIAWLQCQDRQGGEAFWRRQLGDLDGPCLLASSVSAPQEAGNGYWSSRLDEVETRTLQAVAQHQRITLNTLLQGAWALLLRHYTGQSTVIFGATVAGRPSELPGVESLLGLFINTLPVATSISSARPLADWLGDLQANNLQLREYEYLPLYDIQRWAGVGELFDTLLVFENYPIDEALKQSNSDLRIGNVRQHDVTNYPLTLDVAVGATLEIGFDFARSHFGEADIRRISECLKGLLLGIAQQPGSLIGTVSFDCIDCVVTTPALLTRHEDPLLPEAIRLQSQARPDAVALVYGEHILSYAELEVRSNQLAHRLLGLGVQSGAVVGLCLPRSAEMIVASLAVLKCGAAFLPLDTGYPAQRLAYIIEDSLMALLLTERTLENDVLYCRSVDLTLKKSGPNKPLVPLRQIRLSKLDIGQQPETLPGIVIHPEQTAYLIYTSGSTGRPKGVAVSHGALAMHCQAMSDLYAMQFSDVCLHFSSFSFDAAVEQWAVPLASGARVVVSDQDLWSVEQTLEAIASQHINRIDLPPAYLTELAKHLDNSDQAPLLSTCTVGGEALPRDSLALIQSNLRPQRLLNAYGPTETVITPMVWEAAPVCDSAYAPIGQVIGDRTAYVLDADLNLLTTGVAGELYIGGSGLAQGYWQQPGLSAERFLPDPFSAGPGARLYRTGDRVRRRADGVIEYLGRLDQQIKIRGYRIETGEIEAQLLAQPGVNEASVMVRETSMGSQLVAYVAVSDSQLTAETLLDGLKAQLPDNMLPAQIVLLRQLPKLSSGKLDRQALPEPECMVRRITEPRNDTERQLAAIWLEVLGLEQVGVEDNFFELGGHSLTALRLVSLINQRLTWKLPLSRLLQHPTIAALAQETPADPLSPLIALNHSEGMQLPLFCVHPAGGTVFGYYPLARALAGQRQVYGLLCRSFLDSNWRDTSLQAMAVDYARAVMQQQPQGPLHLLGWSLGGALALSMAHQLEQAGREVAFLGLVDSFVPGFDADDNGNEEVDDENLRALLNGIDPGLTLPSSAPAKPSALKPLLNDSTGHPSSELLKLLDIKTGLAIMESLSALSESHFIEPVQAALHCWWSDAGGEAVGFAQDMLEEASGSRVQLSVRIPASHSAIVRHADFIADVLDILNKSACAVS